MIVIFGHNSMRINIVERRFNLRKPWSKGKSLYWIENPFPRIINFFELDNPFSRIAIIRSLDFKHSVISDFNSFPQFSYPTIWGNELQSIRISSTNSVTYITGWDTNWSGFAEWSKIYENSRWLLH